ncbi:hypothetical protein GCM10029963_26170 [Micromonospora andamanensis]
MVVEVVNETPPAGPLPGPPATGSGLLALAERVRLAGGSLSAGACPQGGFAVRARLPVPTPATNADAAFAARPDVIDLPDAAPAGSAAAAGGNPVGAAARRQVRRSLLVALGAPVGLTLALSLIYYPVATVGTVLDRSTFEELPVGVARATWSACRPGRSTGRPGPGRTASTTPTATSRWPSRRGGCASSTGGWSARSG